MSRDGRFGRVAVTVVYCLVCWTLVAWGVLEAYAYRQPWPWIGVAVLELPVSLALVVLYALLAAITPGETFGTVMGYVFLILIVAAPLVNVKLLRRLGRRWRRKRG